MYKMLATNGENSLLIVGSFTKCLIALKKSARWANEATVFRPDGTNIRTEAPKKFGVAIRYLGCDTNAI
jgi:hypothetical protein